jgi:hypothetical protein
MTSSNTRERTPFDARFSDLNLRLPELFHTLMLRKRFE